MQFNYPCLSSGYVGYPRGEQTLNAKFYAEFEIDYVCPPTSLDNKIILFPQRIPRSGFFNEVYQLETNDFRIEFDKKLAHLKDHLRCIAEVTSISLSESNIRYYINWANLCLRYGCFKEVQETSGFVCEDIPHELEVKLLHEAARIEYRLSYNLPVTIDNYAVLANQYLLKSSVSVREKVMLLNSIVVTYYRHQKIDPGNTEGFIYAKHLQKQLANLTQNSLIENLLLSVGYRALAMVNEFDKKKQAFFLTMAEMHGERTLPPNDPNQYVVNENLYTCYQSIAKWHEMNGDLSRAEEYLLKMIRIDEYDSTGHSALGFLYLNQNGHQNAADCFKQAMELGPPGAGMNSYYYAKCLEAMGEHESSVNHLLHTLKLDDKAVSPYLDLFEVYKRDNDMTNAYVIAQNVINTPDLWEQLEDHEKKFLQSYAH